MKQIYFGYRAFLILYKLVRGRIFLVIWILNQLFLNKKELHISIESLYDEFKLKVSELQKQNSLSNQNTRINIHLLDNRFNAFINDINTITNEDLSKESIVLNIRKRFVNLTNEVNSLK